MDANPELAFLNGMQDLDLADTITGDALQLVSPVRGGQPIEFLAQCQTVRRPPQPAAVQPPVIADPNAVAPDRYAQELESRFKDLRKLYYQVKEAKQKQAERIQELEAAQHAKDARIAQLERQVEAAAAPGRRSSGSSREARLVKENEELRARLRGLQEWAGGFRPPPAHCMLPAP
eukprot:TRINITY_DN11308_c0_g2_i1.p2 TRINITY_DN11308_c0_g2~~TRINITY_DN11308_c0_g2_i1.p2  ORF type:complete len:194 (+),score=88.37 TRINITY_DN11308_c0_g2_i1:56-583(+)